MASAENNATLVGFVRRVCLVWRLWGSNGPPKQKQDPATALIRGVSAWNV